MASRFAYGLFLCCLTGLAVAMFWQPLYAESKQAKPTIGWVENVYLMPWEIKLKAKIDTGARTSSLHAEHIERFKKDGENWVRFRLRTEDSDDKPVDVTIERPVERRIRIKDHDSENDSRAVITLPIMLGNRTIETQFSLADRTKFIYPVLLGRRMLKEHAIVDPSRTFVTDLPERPVVDSTTQAQAEKQAQGNSGAD